MSPDLYDLSLGDDHTVGSGFCPAGAVCVCAQVGQLVQVIACHAGQALCLIRTFSWAEELLPHNKTQPDIRFLTKEL